MKRNIFISIFIVLIFSTVWAGGLGEQSQVTSIKVGAFKGPSGFGIIQVMDNPPELDPGFNWDFSILPGPTDMVAKVASGEVDIAVFPVNVAAKMYTAGPGYKLAAVVGEGLLYGITRNPDIANPSDLQGNSIYSVGKGATPDYLLNYLLQATGTEAEVDFSINNPTQLVQMFLAGEVDTVLLPEPFATQVQLKDADARVFADLQELWKNVQNTDATYPITVLVVSPDLAENHPEIVDQFLSAYKASIDFVNNNHDEAGSLIEQYGIFPKAAAVPAISGCNLKFISAADARASLEGFLQVLLESNPVSIGGMLPDDGFYFKN